MKSKSKDCSSCEGRGTVAEFNVGGFTQLVDTKCGLFAIGVDKNVYVYVSNPKRGWKLIPDNIVEESKQQRPEWAE